MKNGIFFGIGVGPGDPELLTVKAIHAIQRADVLIAPKTEKKDGSVALSIARPYLKPDVKIVYQVFPMVRDFAEDPSAWQENKREILELLRDGKNVAFLTLGDPMFFSTYIYVCPLIASARGRLIETIPLACRRLPRLRARADTQSSRAMTSSRLSRRLPDQKESSRPCRPPTMLS